MAAYSKIIVHKRDMCCMCLRDIKVQIFKGTGVCSEDCRKDRDNDHEPADNIIRKAK